MTNEEKATGFICKRRNVPLPKLMPTDFCMGCEENTLDIFNECLGKTGGMITPEEYEQISASNKAAADNKNISILEINDEKGDVSVIKLVNYEQYNKLVESKNSLQKLFNTAINQVIDYKAKNRRLNVSLTAMVTKVNQSNALLRNEQVEKLKLHQALEKILNNEDTPACIKEADCPINGGEGFDNHCNMTCPFVIAKNALEENKCQNLQ